MQHAISAVPNTRLRGQRFRALGLSSLFLLTGTPSVAHGTFGAYNYPAGPLPISNRTEAHTAAHAPTSFSVPVLGQNHTGHALVPAAHSPGPANFILPIFSINPSILPSQGLNLNLASSTANIVLGTNLFSQAQTSVSIKVGGSMHTFQAGQKVTAAEYIAIQQVLSGGSQTVALNSHGTANGGNVDLDQIGSIKVSEIVIPKNVTALDNVAANQVLNISGELLNYGAIDAISTNSKIISGTISAADIVNEKGGEIGTSLPTGTTGNNTVSGVSLNLSSTNNIVNLGQISSAAALTLAAGGSISNGLTGARNSAFSSVPSIKAAGDINFSAGSGEFINAALVSSSNGNVNFAAPSSQTIAIEGSGGTVRALSGNINVRDVSYTGAANTNLSGGNYLSQNLNVYSGTGAITGSLGKVTGNFNSSADAAHVVANTSDFKLGNNTIAGDPLFVNAGGSIEITGSVDVTALGQPLTIVASQDVFTTAADTNAQLINHGGDITVLAGANVINNTGNIITTQLASASTTPANGQVTIDLSKASSSGGNIDLSNSTQTTVLDTSSSSGNGGNITLAAYANGSAGGQVVLPGGSTVTSSSTNSNGNAGNVTIIASATSGNAAQVGNITATGGPGSGTAGNVSIVTAQPTGNNATTIIYDISGAVDPSSPATAIVASANLHGGNVTTGSISGADITISGQTVSQAAGGALNATGAINLTTANLTTPVGDTISGATVLINGLVGQNITINNQGLIQASGGTFIVNGTPGLTDIGGSIFVTGGGTMTNLVGSIGLGAKTSADGQSANVIEFTGSQTFGSPLVLQASGVHQAIIIDSGATVNATDGASGSTPVLVNNGTINGSWSFISPSNLAGTYASTSSIDLNSLAQNLTFTGEQLVILSGGNIIDSGSNTIDLSNLNGNGGSLYLLAGFNFTPAASIGTAPDTSTAFSITSNGTGNISLPNSTINTFSGNGGIGGSVYAYANGTINIGTINTSSSGTGGIGNTGGSVSILGTDVTVGSINTSGGANGAVNITAANLALTFSRSNTDNITVQNGLVYGGSFIPTYAGPVSGNITIGAGGINATATADVTPIIMNCYGGTINAIGTITTGNTGVLNLYGNVGIGSQTQPLTSDAQYVTLSSNNNSYGIVYFTDLNSKAFTLTGSNGAFEFNVSGNGANALIVGPSSSVTGYSISYSNLGAITFNPGSTFNASALTMNTTGTISLANSTITVNPIPFDSRGGGIAITAQSIVINGGGPLLLNASGSGSGGGGYVTVATTSDMTLGGTSNGAIQVTANSGPTGTTAGNISLSTSGQMTIVTDSNGNATGPGLAIYSVALGSSGAGAQIELSAASMTWNCGGAPLQTPLVMNANGIGGGKGGTIQINLSGGQSITTGFQAGDLELGATSGSSGGGGGSIMLSANSLQINPAALNFGPLTTTGAGGTLELTANTSISNAGGGPLILQANGIGGTIDVGEAHNTAPMVVGAMGLQLYANGGSLQVYSAVDLTVDPIYLGVVSGNIPNTGPNYITLSAGQGTGNTGNLLVTGSLNVTPTTSGYPGNILLYSNSSTPMLIGSTKAINGVQGSLTGFAGGNDNSGGTLLIQNSGGPLTIVGQLPQAVNLYLNTGMNGTLTINTPVSSTYGGGVTLNTTLGGATGGSIISDGISSWFTTINTGTQPLTANVLSTYLTVKALGPVTISCTGGLGLGILGITASSISVSSTGSLGAGAATLDATSGSVTLKSVTSLSTDVINAATTVTEICTGSSSTISSCGATTAGGAISISGAGQIVQQGSLLGASVSLSSTDKSSTGRIYTANITATNGTVSLTSIGPITTGEISAVTGVSETCTGSSGAINIGGAITASGSKGAITISDSGADGTISDSYGITAVSEISITAASGKIVQTAPVAIQSSASSVALSAAGPIEVSGAISSETGVTVKDTSTKTNSIVTLGPVSSATGNISLTGLGGLQIGGAVTAAGTINETGGKTGSITNLGAVTTTNTTGKVDIVDGATSGSISISGAVSTDYLTLTAPAGITLNSAVNAGSNATLKASGSAGQISINADFSADAGPISLTGVGGISSTGVISAGSTVVLTAAGANSAIIVNGITATGTRGAVTLTAAGPGGSIGVSGLIKSTNAISLSATKGQISISNSGDLTSTASKTTVTAGYSISELGEIDSADAVSIKTTIPSFSVANSVTVNDISTANGAIVVVGAGALVTTEIGAVITANSSGARPAPAVITIQDSNSQNGSISIGAESVISTSGPAGGNVNICIGAPTTGVIGTIPAMNAASYQINKGPITTYAPQTGQFNFGKNGIRIVSADPSEIQLNSITPPGAKTSKIIFNTGKEAASAITVNGDSSGNVTTITADPPIQAAAPALIPLVAPGQSLGDGARSIVDKLQQGEGATYLTVQQGLYTALSRLGQTDISQSLNVAPIEGGLSQSNMSAITGAQILNQNVDLFALNKSVDALPIGWASETEIASGAIPAAFEGGDFGFLPEFSAIVEIEEVDAGFTSTKSTASDNGNQSGSIAGNVSAPLQGRVSKTECCKKEFALHRGSVLFAPVEDTIVHTRFGTVFIAAKALVLAISYMDGVAIYDLDDGQQGAVKVTSSGHVFPLSPGRSVVLTDGNFERFEGINPAQCFAYRNLRLHPLGPDKKAFTADFSMERAAALVLPVRQLIRSSHPEARRIAGRMLKTTAILSQLQSASSPYQQYIRQNYSASAN
jgi:hypothetical protein